MGGVSRGRDWCKLNVSYSDDGGCSQGQRLSYSVYSQWADRVFSGAEIGVVYSGEGVYVDSLIG